MIKVVLVDDEKNALEVLEWQLKKYCPEVDILALCSSANEAVVAIIQHKPDLIFLDVEMPVKSGFEVLNAFNEPTFDVVFTTAYNQFAIKAFKYAAFDYLLKPIDAVDLTELLKRYQKKQAKTNLGNSQLGKEQLVKQSKPSAKIALHTSDGLQFVKPEQIIRCESLSNYTKVHLNNNQKITLSKTLKEVEETLESYPFYRVHHSHLINLEHIEKYVKADGGYVVMSDGEQITVARNRKEGFVELFSKL
jgi:two-component system, LytTR family, response regulator